MKTYPISLVNLDQRKCVVVGGGKIAARKVNGLVEAGAIVVVISPEVNDQLYKAIEACNANWIRRYYRPDDLDNAFLVIAATDDENVNSQIWMEAIEKNILVNVVDDPDHCNFISPAVVRRDDMTISISSGGKAPALSRRLRQQLEIEFGLEYGTYLSILSELREKSFVLITKENRKNFWKKILNSKVLSLIKKGHIEEARELALNIFREFNNRDEF